MGARSVNLATADPRPFGIGVGGAGGNLMMVNGYIVGCSVGNSAKVLLSWIASERASETETSARSPGKFDVTYIKPKSVTEFLRSNKENAS